MSGSGRDASYVPFASGGMGHSVLPHGRRFLMRCSPQDAVSLAVSRFIEQRFTPCAEELSTLLSTEGSRWAAQAVEIGDVGISKGRELLEDFILDLPVPLDWFVPHRFPPTAVVVAAQPVGDGHTELVIMPHLSAKKGKFKRTSPVSALVDRAINATGDLASATGALVEVGSRLRKVDDLDCPASREKFCALTGWA